MGVPLRDHLRALTTDLLDRSRPTFSLRNEVLELKSIFEDAGGMIPGGGGDIAAGETRTNSGVAISPTMAAMCVDDFARTVQFIRGIHAAIIDQREKHSGRAVRILYAGCGPWATLAVPLMSLFSPNEAEFTLIDVHAESIRSAEKIVRSLGLTDRVKSFEIADASGFELDVVAKPDVIVIEMLRAALESEPQVAVAINLGAQATDAVMIPQEVTIDLALVDPGKEFSLEQDVPERDRIVLGTIFRLDGRVGLAPSVIAIPDFDPLRYRLMLLTTVRVYGEHILRDYDSGITCPKDLGLDSATGDMIEFTYQLRPHPHVAVKVLRNK